MGTGDYRPTNSQLEQHQALHSEVTYQHEKLSQLLTNIECNTNHALQEYGVPILLIRPPDSELCDLFATGPAF